MRTIEVSTQSPAGPSMLPSLIGGALLIALAPILVRVSEVDSVASGFYRVLIAAPFLWLMVGPHDTRRLTSARGPSGDILLMIAAGLLLALDLGVWHISITMTSVANATVFNNCSPIFVAIALTLIGQAPGRVFAMSLAVSTGGMVLLTAGHLSLGTDHLLGDGLAISTGAFYGGYILLMQRLRQRYSTSLCMAVSTTAAVPALLVFAILRGETLIPESVNGWMIVIALGLVCHVAGQGLIARSLAVLPATFSSMVLLVQPVGAAILAWLLFGESQTPLQVLGMSMVLVGILISRKATERAS